ncbi:MAG TPA: hypothetical protein VNT79_09850 [Phycisphaerae bacterium]|nr:hypothetical protein [Phycisphaerae bacterium]
MAVWNPYERFLSEYDATLANLWTLGLVAVWRVVLMTRVVSVLAGVICMVALFPVMLFAGVSLVVATGVAPGPIVHFMGGTRVLPADALIQTVTIFTTMGCVFTFPVWFVGSIIVARLKTVFAGASNAAAVTLRSSSDEGSSGGGSAFWTHQSAKPHLCKVVDRYG